MEKNKNILKKLNPKATLALKIIVYICVAIILVNALFFVLVASSVIKSSFYTTVFLGPIILFMVGICGICMPYINQNVSYQANTKNDRVMVLVGILIIVFAILWLILAIVQYNQNQDSLLTFISNSINI